ncbi:hypothetical protein GGP50_001752 [Salinibacter ruber]|uniref:hypothetical protein n=1 Tax=Salinibacter ruber TaxID=146919 RepID=UPI002166EA08|nr:hypothetical protein [Salinibacter ruber]MCS4193531.1 hypothetical protein [Salinibacter ruber]
MSSPKDDSRNGDPGNGNLENENSAEGSSTEGSPTGNEPDGLSNIQMDLRLAGREELGKESISLFVPLGDREALLRRARESRDYSKPTVFLHDHLHLSLIERIREGTYFPRRLLIAARKPTSLVPAGPVLGESVPPGGGRKESRKSNELPGPEAAEEAETAEGSKTTEEATGIPAPIPPGTLSGRSERTVSLQLTLRGCPRVQGAAEVVNADLGRLEAQVATAGSLFRWPFGRCDLKVLVRAALREIAATVREGEPRLFSRGRGACAKAARPHSETDPRKARLAESDSPEKGSSEESSPGRASSERASLEGISSGGGFPEKRSAKIPPLRSQAAGGVATGSEIGVGAGADSSGEAVSSGEAGSFGEAGPSEEAEGPTAGLQTVLSRPQGFRAGLPTGHSRVPVPLPEEAAKRLESQADGEEWGPTRLVRRGIGWIASLAATDLAEALSKAEEARRLRKNLRERKNLKGKGAQDAGDSRPAGLKQGKLFESQGESARGERRCTLELGPTRRVALKEAIRSLSASTAGRGEETSGLGLEEVGLEEVRLEDLTCAAALWSAGLLEGPDATAPSRQKTSIWEGNSWKGGSREESSWEGSSSQEGGGMPGPRLFEKPEGQDRSGHQIRIAITPEAEGRLGRKARRYFRTPTEMARLAIGRMARWARRRPAEAFEYADEESNLYQPPHESEKSQYGFQLYVSFEMKVSVWRARRALQKGPAVGLGRRVTGRQIYQAAARLAIESMEVSAPLAE